MQLQIDNGLAPRGAPLFAKPLHFSQFGHDRGYPCWKRGQSPARIRAWPNTCLLKTC
jgi:hypothetical protein